MSRRRVEEGAVDSVEGGVFEFGDPETVGAVPTGSDNSAVSSSIDSSFFGDSDNGGIFEFGDPETVGGITI
ncbi:MAG: hypothetical protein JXR42_01855 [Gammaproteobacteria bacterium]|nr:hypothetical protein [Gammaproteobacteria bacterium]